MKTRIACFLVTISLTPCVGLAIEEPIDSNRLARLVPRLEASSRERLLRLVEDPAYAGRIASSDVRWICEQERCSTEQLMQRLLPLAQAYASTPLSKFHVGAICRGTGGDLYLGANIEIPGQPIGFSVHAEQAAVAVAFMQGARGITALATSASPCGHCRQFLLEFVDPTRLAILCPDEEETTLSCLLPRSFRPDRLGNQTDPFNQGRARLTLEGSPSTDLALVALKAAARSYAPYTKALSGVAIRSRTGRVFAGSYFENVAYNPSLPPLQTAYIGLVMAGEPLTNARQVILVELRDARITQRDTIGAVLRSASPDSELEFHPARRID